MKKVLFLASLLVMVMVASTAMASTVTLYYSPWQNNSGGEFQLSGANFGGVYADTTRNQSSSYSPSFQSFCLETNEYIGNNVTYNFTVDPSAVGGGSGGAVGGKDPVSAGTAWLYWQFAKGTLVNYDFANTGVGRKNSADALQKTIWWLEDETAFNGWDGVLPETFKQALTGQFGDNYSVDARAANNTYGVYALNLTLSGDNKQSMLVATPVPPSVWLLGSGLVGLFGMRRRFFG